MRLERLRQFAAGSQRFLVGQEAATATEYAVMLALMISVMIGIITLFGRQVSNMYVSVVNATW